MTFCYVQALTFKFCMSRNVRKRTFGHVPSTKTQISLRIRAVWSESSLSAWSNFASLAIQNAPSEDSDQTAQMRSLIWIFAGRICREILFVRCGSYLFFVRLLTWYYHLALSSFFRTSGRFIHPSVKSILFKTRIIVFDSSTEYTGLTFAALYTKTKHFLQTEEIPMRRLYTVGYLLFFFFFFFFFCLLFFLSVCLTDMQTATTDMSNYTRNTGMKGLKPFM